MVKEILVPDIGSYSNVDIIEVLVAPGDVIKVDSSLITLETDKATLEVPSPVAGVVRTVHVKVGDKVSEGSLIVSAEVESSTMTAAAATTPPATPTAPTTSPAPTLPSPASPSALMSYSTASEGEGPIHAGPAVRRFARELGVDLASVSGTGLKNRILKHDVQLYVKNTLQRLQSGLAVTGNSGGLSVAPWPQIDFSKFGEISREALSRIKKLSGSFLHRNWVMVPHVTQFDEADITELENFRKSACFIRHNRYHTVTKILIFT